MHITSDGLEYFEAMSMMLGHGISVIPSEKIDNYYELYIDRDDDGSKKKIGYIGPSETHKGKYVLSCDLPRETYKPREMKHFSFSRKELTPDDLAQLL